MIKSNELRLGNWVKYIGKSFTVAHYHLEQGQLLEVENIESDCVNDTSPYYDISCEYLEPIPLTPEILEQAGFKKDKIDELDNVDGYIVNGRLSIFLEPVLLEDGSIHWFTHIQFNIGMGFNLLVTNPPQYLHELQNLYFFLTGQELEINLTVDTPKQLQ